MIGRTWDVFVWYYQKSSSCRSHGKIVPLTGGSDIDSCFHEGRDYSEFSFSNKNEAKVFADRVIDEMEGELEGIVKYLEFHQPLKPISRD